jgi:soluble lytic murein transglycosylase-like protein
MKYAIMVVLAAGFALWHESQGNPVQDINYDVPIYMQGMGEPPVETDGGILFENIPDNDTLSTMEKEASVVAKRYKLPLTKAKKIVNLAHKHAKKTFPKRRDILASIAIESAFNHNAVSKLAKDPAKGLMQVRHQVWESKVKGLDMSDPENQIKVGSDILLEYYKQLGNKQAAIQAYNVGITAYVNGKRNEVYLNRHSQVKSALDRT